MKYFVVLGAVLMCLQSASSLFYGANTGLPQTKTLSSAINKCSTANEQVKSDTCQVVKTILKFKNPNYVSAVRDLTGMEYTFQSIGAFYNNFLVCLNDQNSTVSNTETMLNLDHLIYQLSTFVQTSINFNLVKAADSLGLVFGERTKNTLTIITKQYLDEFQILEDNLKLIREQFEQINEDGAVISVETINATISIDAFNNMITALKDIEVTTKQCSSVVSNFVGIATTLDKMTNVVSSAQATAIQMVTTSDLNMAVSIQASKKMFSKKTLALQNDVDDAFSEFQSNVAEMFYGDEEAFEYRVSAENFVIELKSYFDESSKTFNGFFTEVEKESTRKNADVRRRISEYSEKITTYIADSVSENSGSFARCFSSLDASGTAKLLIEGLAMNSTYCISQQTNTSLVAQSLLTFISEDSVLNAKTQADRLCACAVKGDKKTNEKSKRCFKRRIDELSQIQVEERDYISTERENVFKIVTKSSETFDTCTEQLFAKFDLGFERFQTAISRCLAFDIFNKRNGK